MKNKVIQFSHISEAVQEYRQNVKNAIVVLCHGCFDIVHPGHIRHLKFAKEQGTFLVVSITPDVCIQKGSSRPFVPEGLRAENLAALEIVDAVTIVPGETGLDSIHAILPDIYVKGSEYAVSTDPRFLEEKVCVEEYGGKVAYSSGEVVFSSSRFIRDSDFYTADLEKLKYLCERYDIRTDVIHEILQGAKEKKILIVGEALIDQYKYCEGLSVAEESPVLSLSHKHSTRYVSASGALALHLAAIGVDVTFLTSVDMTNGDADFFRYNLEDAGINVINVESRNRSLILKAHYFVGRNQVMEVDYGSYSPLDSNLRTQIIKQFRRELKSAPDAIVLSDFGYGLLTEDLVIKMSRSAKTKGIKLFSDIAMTYRNRLERFYTSNIMSLSELELRSCMHDYESGLSVLVDKFYGNSKVEELYLMLSDGSAIYFKRPDKPGVHNMESAHIPSLYHINQDTMGKGEAFLAGIVLSRLMDATEVQSLYLGSIFFAVHAEKSGNLTVNIEEIFHHISKRKELI